MAAVKEAPVGVVLANMALSITFCNPEVERLSGLASEALLGKKVSRLKFFDVRHASKEPMDFRSCFSGRQTKIAKTAFLESADGTQTLVLLNAKFVTVGKVAMLMLVMTDLSREIACSTVATVPLIISDKEALRKIVGRDESILELYRLIELAAESMANVSITGESGTGKELVANAIHLLSPRKSKPFIKVNCSALPETLLESELFGHVKGSFTGAYQDKIGKFEAAGGGTVFLDEIGEISPMIQVKLLRVIQEKTIERVGDNKPVKVDMRIITATNRNLREMVKNGQFREDLFYRLNVFPVSTTPLRNRMKDVPLLIDHFVRKFNQATGKHIHGLTENAYRIMLDYCWPGNVRELENAIEYAFVVCNKKMIDLVDLPQDLRMVPLRQELCRNLSQPASTAAVHQPPDRVPTDTALNFNRYTFRLLSAEQIQAALDQHHYSRKETAKYFGVSTVALWRRMKKLGLLE